MGSKELFKDCEIDIALNTLIVDCWVSPKLLENLNGAGVMKIKDLCFMNKTEALSIKGIGSFYIGELEQLLADLGLTFMRKL